ncbi:transglycosylase SLT domain-containing protein [Streptomyces sp. NPDC050564]|uniref:transglycosylase SLT domain-containing protein n=1 Tax=Streptomyces sp. NPDC050564 TaxID=3365631 RepID=UPI0037A976D7
MKGIVGGFGTSLVAGIAPAGPAIAALAPALATAGAAAGALKLGLSGVGDAFKAAFADTSKQASSAASATKAVESAQRGLANAQRALADARVQAAQRVQDAQKQVLSAERDLTDAQRDARDVQADLNSARQEASRALEDMNQRLAESQLNERDAVLRLSEAQKELTAAQSKPGVTPDELARLQLAYDRAKLNLQEQQTETKRLKDDTSKANKAGVDGSAQVLAARQKIAEADRNVADKQQALSDAQAGVDQARADGARQIQDAQRGVADAAAAVADAQAAAAAQTSQLDQAMSKLAPNAQSFVRAVQGLGPAWDHMRLSVQNALFQGLDGTVSTLGRTTIPILQRQLTATGGIWNQIAKSAAGAITGMAKSGMLDKILSGANKNLAVFKDTPKQLITAFGQLTVAAQPAFNKLLTGFAGAIKSFTDGLSKSFTSGGLKQAIDTAFGLISQLGGILGDAFATVSNILKAASDAGGQALGVVGALFEQLRKITAMPEVQAALKQIFTSVAQIVGAIAPVIGAIIQAALPLVAALAPVIATLAQTLGPALATLATALGQALMPIITALSPAITVVGDALARMVTALSPVLVVIGQVLGMIVDALMPIFTPLVGLITQVVEALAGPLTAVFEGLKPYYGLLGQLFTTVFGAIAPLIGPVVDVLGQVAKLLAGVFSQAIGIAVDAITPLVPVIGDMISTFVDALLPVMPTLSDAFTAIADAALQLLAPLGDVASQLVTSLAPVLADITPVIAELAGLFAGALAQALPPLTGVLLTLVQALDPLWPLISQIVAQVLELAAGVLVQLMPSILQLVQAGIGLSLALLPLLPSLAQIVTLVLELAVNVLSWLLPPLLGLVSLLVGAFATALSTAIGWISGMVKWVSTLVGWVVDHLVPAFLTLRDKGIAAWGKLKSGISTAWGAIKAYVLYPIRDFFTKTVPGWATTLKNKVVGAFNGARDGLGTAWSAIKRNVLNPIGTFFTKTIPGWGTTLKNGMVGAFDAARKGIKIAWDKLKDIAKVPVAFVVNTVYNDGLRKVWNLVTDAFGGKHLDPIRGFATGGIMPGYTPGRDVHLVPSTAGPVALSGGEAIMRPEWTRAVGPGYVEAMNAAARQGGVGGVRGALGFKDGGIFSGIGDALGGAWDKVKSGYNWLKDTFGGAVKAGVKHVVYPLIDAIPGGKIGFVGMLKDAMKNLALKLVGAGEEGDKRSTPNVKYTPSKGVEQWRPVVLKALAEVHQSRGLAQSTLRRMNQESGGNPKAVNLWDSNAKAGYPSTGLMQVIRPTFQHYAGKYRHKGPFMYGVSIDPMANIYSSMKYALGAYGSLSRAYDRPGGYDSGGWLGPGQSGVNNLRQPEAVLTPAQWSTMATLADRSALGDMTVNVWVGNQQITDITRAEIRNAEQELLQVLNAN